MTKFNKIEKIDIDSREFPESLRSINDPPKQLYFSGDPELLHRESAAIVGSRKYTIYGKNVAEMIGKKFALAGIPVVSGLAMGIDGFAHHGVLKGDGKCIAVLGSGLNKMTPPSNRKLMYDLLDAGGIVLSEYEPDVDPAPWTFPQRNRIISGLSRIVVVVEANYNSGALITAQCANEQGRTVYAVPGNINSQFSMGSNLLIRDGAIPLIVVDDAIRDMGCEAKPEEDMKMQLDVDEIKIIEEISRYNGVTADKLAMSLNMRVAQVNAIATVLEIKGVVEIYGGKIHLAK